MIRSCRLLLVLAAAATVAACGKKESQASCTAPRVPIPAFLGFSGFTADQLDTVFVATYAGADNFSVLQDRDTAFMDSLSIENGIARKNGAECPFSLLETGSDYRVTVPATGQTFAITRVSRSGDSLYRYTSENGCNLKGSITWSPDAATVNGIPVTLSKVSSTAANFLFLVR